MNASAIKSQLENLIAMVRLLERVDANPSLIGAAQYQNLSRMVRSLLTEDLPVEALQAILGASAAAAVLYENIHYDRSGLSQSPLDAAVASELLACEVIARVRSGAKPTN